MRFQPVKFQVILTMITAFLVLPVRAETGVTDKKVVIGIVNDQTGQIKNLGLETTAGIQLVFNKVNAAGGIAGRQLEVLIRDDKYDPRLAFAAADDLLNKEKVFVLMGATGTPTSKAMQPIVEKAQSLFLVPVTGAEFLRTPFQPRIFPLQASYADEAEMLVHQIVDVEKIKDVGIFMQDDSYGEAAKLAVYGALHKRNLKSVGEGIYSRGSVAIEEALQKLIHAKPKAILLFASLKPTAEFLKRAKELKFEPVLAGSSVINYDDLIKEAGPLADGLMFPDSIPLVSDTSIEIVKNFQADMKAANNELLTAATLKGYIGATVVAEALKKAGAQLTHESLKAALESFGATNLHGLRLEYSPTFHQGLSRVILYKINHGKIEKI